MRDNGWFKGRVPQSIPVEAIKPHVFLDLSDPATAITKSLHGIIAAKTHKS